MTAAFEPGSRSATIDDLIRVARDHQTVRISPAARAHMARGRHIVEQAITTGLPVYGLNTGLGHLQGERVEPGVLKALQRRVIRAHLGGVGPAMAEEDVRAMIVSRVVGMCRGGSGADPDCCEALAAMLNASVWPFVPNFGSVGASDLTHMAAIAAVLIGDGRAWSNGEVVAGEVALRRVGLAPYVPLAKEGLALISANGAAVGLGALTLHRLSCLANLADRTALLSLEAIGGNPGIIDPLIAEAKPFAGLLLTIKLLQELLSDSDILRRPPSNVQDPLAFRVMPQVHGALRDSLSAAVYAVETELNAMDDNPLVSITSNRIISNGNFHPMQVAICFDSLRVMLAHVAMLAERRLARTSPDTFGSLEDVEAPAHRPHGLELGSYAAASLVAEMRFLANPMSLHCPPLDYGTEDHATLATSSVLRTREALAYLETILVIEALLAYDRLYLLPNPPRIGTGLKPLVDTLEHIYADTNQPMDFWEAVEAARQGFAGAIRSTTAPAD